MVRNFTKNKYFHAVFCHQLYNDLLCNCIDYVFFSAGWDDHRILYVYVLYVATNVDSNVLVLNDGKLIYNYNNDADIMPLLTCFISDTYCNICDNDKCTNFTYLAKFIFTFNTLLMVYPP